MSARMFDRDEMNIIRVGDIEVKLTEAGLVIVQEDRFVLIPWADLQTILKEIELRKKLLRGMLAEDLADRLGEDF